MDDLFDALNNTRLHTKKTCNHVLCDKNTEVLNAINAGYELLKNLQKVSPTGKLTRPNCFDGFLITIKAVEFFLLARKV